MSQDQAPARRSAGWLKLAGVALAAFAFTFALVPLYRIACEKVFGIRLEQGPPANAAAGAAAAQDRWVTVQFDGGVNSKLPWQFKPEQMTMKVQPGKQYEAMYYARNTSDRAITGRATFNVEPEQAGKYFNKVQCFCFTEQTLRPGEEVRMPVLFYVDPKAKDDPEMKGVEQITLSYTFHQANDPAS